MRSAPLPQRSLVTLLTLLSAANLAWADGSADKFHRAYYLEHEQRDYTAASKLYAEVATDRTADAELKARAAARAAACEEELACADFAALMPPESLAFVELNRPGQRVLGLLRSLGLTADADKAAEAGGRHVAISPELVRELLGIRGIAIAVTGFDPFSQMPSGVAVLHPGDVAVIRGLIETALPAAAQRAKSIAGFPTYDIEGQVLFTLTQRLIIISQQAGEIEGVIRRLKGDENESLATNAALRDVLSDRDDALLFFCVNARPIMPMINALLSAAGGESRELAMAQAVLDLNSLQALSGKIDLGEAGIRLDLSLQLAEGHHNLVYNFLRMPALDRETLKCIPAGAAAFTVFSLNEAATRDGGRPIPTGDVQSIVTAMDIGREIFANIVSVGAFVLPPSAGGQAGGIPIPDAAIVMTVNNPEKSAALWGHALGLASLAAGGRSIAGETVELEGAKVRSFALPEGITILMATSGHHMVLSPSRAALGRALAAKRGGQSILEDDAFRSGLERLSGDNTVAVFAHAGRCVEIGRPYMDDDELDEIRPLIDRLDHTVASLVVTHSDQLYRLSLMVTGLPRVDDLVTQLIEHGEIRMTNRRQAIQHADAARAEAELARAALSESRQAAAERTAPEPFADSKSPAHPSRDDADRSDAKSLMQRFDKLATSAGDVNAARELAEQLFDAIRDDPAKLNELAWPLLTEDRYGGRFDKLALRMAVRCNELTEYENWMFVDTLAWANFKTGDVETAVDLEKKALALCKNRDRVDEVKEALAKFEDALRNREAEPVSANDLR